LPAEIFGVYSVKGWKKTPALVHHHINGPKLNRGTHNAFGPVSPQCQLSAVHQFQFAVLVIVIADVMFPGVRNPRDNPFDTSSPSRGRPVSTHR